MIDFWAKTSGTWINVFTVAVGTTLGLTLKNRLTQKMQLIITQGIGLITVWIGLSMANTMSQVKAGNLEGVILGLLAMVIGGIIGEWLEIEERLTALGNYLKKRFRGQGLFTEGFVASSLLFCVGPMTLIGSLNNGLTGDNTLLTIKATMDGIVSIALANIYGIGVGCSILVLLIYQGGLSLAASAIATNLTNPESNPYILIATGVGGLIIVGIGFNLLEITKIRVASFLPAIVISSLIYYLASIF
ncbi:conserved membrane hypothetical protein [Hyella patelloides LEGE 07179]|uniref:Membrane protein YdfK n=1 Tax=Hyella patelloides LEGE 07179 TaxID=945734 RepID=A0A563VSE2_9CYAN|nr:DUF554 domain-containing protein [Hyella patelloides]VEP14345.1 conserved membrane hypothetical protein [Hyella patelloides LEGE 07179]